MSLAKNWTFTLNNPTNEEIMHFRQLDGDLEACVSYCVYQVEEGAAGTQHFQGYLQLAAKKRLSHLKRFVSVRAHWEVARGSPEQNRIYCTKEPRVSPPREFGIMSTQGKRSDIEAFVAEMQENVLDESQVLEKHPMILAKYPRFVSTTRRILTEKRIPVSTFTPQPGWQVQLRDSLLGQPDPRRVTWYSDERGGAGKSTFGIRFRLPDGSRPFLITGGRHADVYYAYNRQQVVIFDWPRSNEETFPYAVAEAFKNGYFLSTKYESTPVYFEVPHVIIFANFYPDKTKLSADRWDIHIINNSLL